MSLALNEAQFAIFIQFLKQESTDSLTIRKAVTRIGQQQNTELWVLGDGVHINAEGALVPKEVYIWLDWSVQQGLSNVSMKEVVPTILLPLSTTILHRAVELLRAIMRHNFIPAILMVAGSVMSLHYSTHHTINWLPNCHCQWTITDREVNSHECCIFHHGYV